MGKYSSSARRPPTPKSQGPHDIWRGIGCLMMLIIPVISMAAGYATVNLAIVNRWPIPYQLLGAPRLPDFFYKSGGLLMVFGPLTRIQNLYSYIVTGILYIILIGGVISVVYAVIYRMVGPSRYGPTDAPPPKIKTKRYTR
jgi:hypothetical protein